MQVGIDRPVALLAAGSPGGGWPTCWSRPATASPVVGPLVPPPAGPACNCLDLHRRDRDPGWPELAAQLAGDAGPTRAARRRSSRRPRYAAAEVLAYLDGGTPETVGATVEIAAPGPRPPARAGRRTRAVRLHPSAGHDVGSSAAGRSVTMIG